MIPPLLRRRLNLLGRAAASQMLRLLGDTADIPVVYCSRHGDIDRTVSILEQIVREEQVSPMNFSLSVHNAVPGLVSIHQQITTNISSIASGEEPLIPGILEALGMLSPDCPSALCVFTDVPLPAVFRESPDPVSRAYASAFLLGRDTGRKLSLAMSEEPVASAGENIEPVALRFARFLDGSRESMPVSHNRNQWLISKV